MYNQINKGKREKDTMAKKKDIIVTTCDLKREYRVIGPVYFQVSNKGIFNNALYQLVDKYHREIIRMRQQGVMSEQRTDWGFLYGEWSVGQNEFEKAFFVATEELKERARLLGADAIIGMRQDIDMDTTGFQYFYLQMYGTAVKFLDGEAEELPEIQHETQVEVPAPVYEEVTESVMDDETFLVEAEYLNTGTKIANMFEKVYGASNDEHIKRMLVILSQLRNMEGMSGNSKDAAMRWIKGFFENGKKFYRAEKSGGKAICPVCGKAQPKNNSICESCGVLFDN